MITFKKKCFITISGAHEMLTWLQQNLLPIAVGAVVTIGAIFLAEESKKKRLSGIIKKPF